MNLDNKILDKINKLMDNTYTNPISEDEASDIIEELVHEIEEKEEALDRLNQEIEENFKPIPIAQQCGISEKDFI